MTRAQLSFAILVLASLAACKPASPPANEQASSAAPAGETAAPAAPAAVAAITELQKTDLAVGTGDAIVAGKEAVVHYTGWLYDPQASEQKGTKFDSSRDRGQPFSFNVGAGSVIRGWDEGVVGMQVGGQRRLIIPPDMAYGDRSSGPIPPGSTLLFDVELLAIK